jgi:flagellar L-ring protein precursor FlgH
MSRPEPALALILALALAGCAQLREVGQTPELTPINTTPEHVAMMDPGLPYAIQTMPTVPQVASASLWTGDRGSLLGDNRAVQRGDILTVVIEIDDSASFSNSSDRARDSSQTMSVGALLGLPEAVDINGPGLNPALETSSATAFSGDGSIRRNEQLQLRVAATVMDVLPNGVLSIMGSQEVRVNYELRELLVTGFVRPADITRQNEITYDKIASARISYGGRGLISGVQQPPVGQQITDILTPF